MINEYFEDGDTPTNYGIECFVANSFADYSQNSRNWFSSITDEERRSLWEIGVENNFSMLHNGQMPDIDTEENEIYLYHNRFSFVHRSYIDSLFSPCIPEFEFKNKFDSDLYKLLPFKEAIIYFFFPSKDPLSMREKDYIEGCLEKYNKRFKLLIVFVPSEEYDLEYSIFAKIDAKGHL